MDYENLIAIDIHTHAEVSCRNPFDNYGEEYDRAADKYFGSSNRPTIDETVAYYRERKIGLVMFTVDSESQMGRRRIPNEEIADAAKKNSDMMIAFGSIDPHKGKMGAREAQRLIEEDGIKGFTSTPICLTHADVGQRNLLRCPDRKLLNLGIDAGGVQSRRVIDRYLALEA